jgi:hypothetical protein
MSENPVNLNKVRDRSQTNNPEDAEEKEVLVVKPKERIIVDHPLSLKNTVTYIAIFYAAFLYILSLEGCQWDTQTACLVNLSPEFFYKIAVFLITSSFTVSFILLLILLGYLSNKHLLYIGIIFIYLAHFHDTGANLTNHGSYNKSAFYAFLVVDLFILTILRLLLKLVQMKYIKLFFMILGLSFAISVLLSYKLRKGCDRWTWGLKDKVISDYGSCKIKEPQSCWVELLDGLMDVSWLLQEDCQNFRYGERAELLKYIPKRYHDSYKLAYPITTNFTYIPESYHMPFFWNLMSTFIDLEEPRNNNMTNNYYKQKPEVVLEFDRKTKLGTVHIDVNRDEELVKQREALRSKNPTKVENILYIYIDSISRQHFLRKMKKTKAFIEKYMGADNNEPLKSYQFMKYHTFIYFTQPNINPMFYGESMYHNNGTHIIKHFKEKGFITGHSVNICSRELYDIEDGYIKNLTWEAFDHENVALFCDPNFFNPENPFTPYMGPYSVRKRCLYGKDTFEYVLDYGEKFWKTYEKERKFLRVAFEDAHEGTGEVARYLDDRLITFLETFERNGWLNDTAIIFTSDHGNNMIGFYNIFNCEDFFLEKTLGTFFLLLPNQDKFNNTNLLHNEEVMVTPYDVYNTMMDLVNIDRGSKYISRLGESVLDKVDHEKARNCENYRLDLQDLWCRCANNL